MVNQTTLKQRRVRSSREDRLFFTIDVALLSLAFIVVLYPLVYIVSSSISDPYAVLAGEVWLFPVRPTLEGYRAVLAYSDVWMGYANTIFYAVVGTALWGYGMATWTDAAVPYGDAFTTVASLCAQWMLARKRLEAWLYWIAVDVVAICIYFHKGLYVTTGLYTVFLGLAIWGLVRWHREWKQQQSPEGGTA